MVDCIHLQALACAERAATRAAVIAHRELEGRVASLKAVACIAPLLGALGTAHGLMQASAVWDLPCSVLGDLSGGPAEALIFIALSLPVAAVAYAGFYYLNRRVKTFDFEMRVATVDLVNGLARLSSSNIAKG